MICIHTCIHTLHYMTFHCITLHYIHIVIYLYVCVHVYLNHSKPCSMMFGIYMIVLLVLLAAHSQQWGKQVDLWSISHITLNFNCWLGLETIDYRLHVCIYIL